MSTLISAGTSTSGAVINSDTSGSLQLQTGSTPTTAVTIDTAQNVGVGVTPNAWSNFKAIQMTNGVGLASYTAGAVIMNLGANQYYNGSNYVYVNSDYSTSYQQTAGVHKWWVAPSGTAGATITETQAMTLSNAGNLQVPAMYSATVTTPRNVYIDSSGNLGGISSTRASKSNIVNQDSASWIYQLTPVTFNYRKKDAEGNYTEEVESEVQYGLIAEDVEGIKPEFCIYVNGKLAGVHYDRMVSPMIKALQELNAKFESYKATHP